MSITIKINCDNAAFNEHWRSSAREDAEHEVSRILKSISDKVRHFGVVSQNVFDVNGNVVGKVIVKMGKGKKKCM